LRGDFREFETQVNLAPSIDVTRFVIARLALLVPALLVGVAPASANDPFLRRTATVRVVKKVGPAVVNITTQRVVGVRRPFQPFAGDPFFERFFRDFFEPRAPQTTQSLGSGVIIDGSGHVLTNEHVVSRADAIRVTLADGREFEATLVGADPNNDLAVLRLETDEKVPSVAPGSSADLMVGEPVIAISPSETPSGSPTR
jgi:S1-C subfamily serine protease